MSEYIWEGKKVLNENPNIFALYNQRIFGRINILVNKCSNLYECLNIRYTLIYTLYSVHSSLSCAVATIAVIQTTGPKDNFLSHQYLLWWLYSALWYRSCPPPLSVGERMREGGGVNTKTIF